MIFISLARLLTAKTQGQIDYIAKYIYRLSVYPDSNDK